MRYPTLVMQHPDRVINASRSPFLLLTKTPSSRKARALAQPTSGVSEIAAEVGRKRERCSTHPGSLILTLVT